MRASEITAIVLCGGTGSRLGGVDKPMARVRGRPLVEYVIEALRPQVGGFIISCGPDPTPYEALGHPTVPDARPGDGPLGGIVSALAVVGTEWLLTHPGDAPFPDASLVPRLTPVAEASGIAVPRAGDHRQNLTLLMSRTNAEALRRFYEGGGRAVKDWLDERGVESVDMTDVAGSFLDVDSPADLVECERRLS